MHDVPASSRTEAFGRAPIDVHEAGPEAVFVNAVVVVSCVGGPARHDAQRSVARVYDMVARCAGE